MIKYLSILCLLSSCSFGWIRDSHELEKVRSVEKIDNPFPDKVKIEGTYYRWYSDEIEVVTSKEAKIQEHILEKGSRIVFDEDGRFLKYLTPSKKIFCIMDYEGRKIERKNRNGCVFLKSDLNSGNGKYSLFSRNLPTEIDRKKFIIYVEPLFACSGIVKAIAVNDFMFHNVKLNEGDIVYLKMNKIWKINETVIDKEMNKDYCRFFRTENYKLEY